MCRAAVYLVSILSAALTSAALPASAATPPQPADTVEATAPYTADAATRPTTQPATRPVGEAVAPLAPLVETVGTAGFWRVGRQADGVWWFVSPTGQREFLNTVTTVQPFQKGRREKGPHYVSRDWAGGVDGGPEARSEGNLHAWATATLRRVHEAGFKGLGAWSNRTFHQYDVPMTRDLNVWAWAHGPASRLYHPQWKQIVEEAIKTQCLPLRDNVNLVGYYTDNELHWDDEGNGPGVYFNGLPATDPNKIEVVKVIRQTWPDVAHFNADWHTDLKSFDDLLNRPALDYANPEAYQRLFTAWLEHLATDYFRTTSELIKKYDPNHLILGVRFKGYAPVEVVRAARKYTDAVSLNYYVSDAKLDRKMFSMMAEVSGRPVIITEYSFHALDGRSGDRNTFGFPAQVMDQRARADGYRLGTTRLARVPYVIGADWFQWSDEPPTGRAMDGEDVNFGVVDVDDRPYPQLVKAVQETTPKLNGLHAASAGDARADVWRAGYDRRPTAQVPYLSPREVPTINGELSDWPAAAKLAGLRHSETVGLDRNDLPPPNVYLGWNEAGLYVGFEVFDRDIAGAPATGWWWTRDHAEFWVSTKPVEDDQTWYTPACHQFFYVPVEFPGRDGASGVVGQWHRKGDGLSDNVVPQRQVISATRILPDRYVVELFIPADALKDFDPSGHSEMAFNFCAANFQTAVSYYWSAPKEVLTQNRPNTWGHLVLLPPQSKQPDAVAAVATGELP